LPVRREYGKEVEGVLKIARDPCSKPVVANEPPSSAACARSTPTAGSRRFLPAVEEIVRRRRASAGTARQASVLRLHESIRHADELYTLDEVRAQYPAGLEQRHAAWIWRAVAQRPRLRAQALGVHAAVCRCTC